MKFNKKGGVPELIDWLLIISIGIGVAFLVGAALFISSDRSETQSFTLVKDFKQKSSAINNLRVEIQEGVNLENQNIDRIIAESKKLGGKVITDCYDYLTEVDCRDDTVDVVEEYVIGDMLHGCVWQDESCIPGSRRIKQCNDYPQKSSCESDTAGVLGDKENRQCSWDESSGVCLEKEISGGVA